MEIIHVILGKANPERMNGVNKVVYQLATRQTAAGIQVSVWGITKDTARNFPDRNFNTRLFQSYPNKFRLDPQLSAAIRDKQPDKVVYHLHGGFNPVLYSVAMELCRQQQPYVFTPHGAYNTIAMKKSYIRKKIYFRLFEKKMLQGAAAIHSLGASEINGLQAIYLNQKSVLIPYGFELQQAETERSAGEKFIIGYCGRIDIYTKGLDLLVHSFANFLELMPDAELWIIGGGEEENKLRKMISRLKIDKQVKLWGAMFGAEKENVMKQFSVFAHPSRNEGLPTAVLEAAGMGIPCVVTTATNTAAVIEKYEAGETIPVPETNALCHALQNLNWKINVTGYDEISDNARRMVSEEFNWQTIIHRFHTMYQNV